jgi:hypothetical protein
MSRKETTRYYVNELSLFVTLFLWFNRKAVEFAGSSRLCLCNLSYPYTSSIFFNLNFSGRNRTIEQ